MKLEELVFSGLGRLKKVISEKYNIPIEELDDPFDDAEGYYVDEVVEAYNQGLDAGHAEGHAEGMEHVEAWKAVAEACTAVMIARYGEGEAYEALEAIKQDLGTSVEELAEEQASWEEADGRLLEAEKVLREARAVVRDLEK